MAEKKERPHNIVADNRKARFNYEIGELFEAGMLPPAPFCAASGCVCWDREGPCRGFCAPAEQQVGALLIGSDAFFWAARDQIISLAARYAIPTMVFDSTAVASSGLSSYAPDLPTRIVRPA